jgi:hypothetical protein
MITIDIDFSDDLPKDQRESYAKRIIEDFPFHYVDHSEALNIDEVAGVQLFIQIAQCEMTDEQERYLNKFDYIREYNPRPIAIVTPTLTPWAVRTYLEITENTPHTVPTNGRCTRFYTEPVHEQQWNKLHHLIDVEGEQPMYGEVTITQFAEDSAATQVTLTHNEVDDLLTVLLRRRLATEKESHENLQRVKQQEQPYIVQKGDDFLSDDGLDSLDDHPF